MRPLDIFPPESQAKLSNETSRGRPLAGYSPTMPPTIALIGFLPIKECVHWLSVMFVEEKSCCSSNGSNSVVNSINTKI